MSSFKLDYHGNVHLNRMDLLPDILDEDFEV